MNKKGNEIVKIAIVWALTVAIAITSTFFVTKSIYEKPGNSQPEEGKGSLYEIAVADSMNAETEEILPLVTVTKDSPHGYMEQ